MTPQRIQLRRTKGYHMPPNTIKVCRPSPWGNPFKVGMLGVPDRATAVALFERALQRGDLADDHTRFVFTPERIRIFLGGKNLACWCPLPAPGEPDLCHAAVLLRIANQAPSQREASRGES